MLIPYIRLKKIARIFASVTLSSAALLSLPVHAATVTLNNGDRLSGELLQLDDNVLIFKSSVFGEVNIPWDEVQSLVSDEGVHIELQDGTVAQGRIVVEESTVAIQVEDEAQANAVQREDLKALNPTIVDPSRKYSGRLDVGGAFNRGNSNDDQVNIAGELIGRSPKDRYTLGLEVNEARSFGTTTTSNRRLLTQYDAFLNEKDFLFANARLERDEMADLDLRTSLGAGYGRQFIDRDVLRLSGQVGVNYVKEDYALSPDQSFPTLSIGLRFDREFFERRLVYFQYMDMDTSLRDAQDMRLRTRLGLRVPVVKGINVSTQLNHDYVNRPATDKKKSDTTLLFSVGYGF